MPNRFLLLSTICLITFCQHATAATEIFRAWQNFNIQSIASGTHDAIPAGDTKHTAFGAILPGAQGGGLSSSAPHSSASAYITVWGWRTNISGDTYHFNADFAGIVGQTPPSGVSAPGGANAAIDYKQIYDFSISTITGGTETITIDVWHLDFTPPLPFTVNLSAIHPTPQPPGSAYFGFSIPGSHSIVLPDGDYRLEIGFNYYLAIDGLTYGARAFSGSWSNSVRFSHLTPSPGWHFSFPVIKNPGSCPLCYDFRNIPRGTWVGTSAANEFSFQMLGNSSFTGIMGFPPGFTNQFEVVVDDTSVGFFTTNQPVNFIDAVGRGVSSFKVRNIAPLGEGNVTNTFPIILNFDTSTADFLMLPNPSLRMISETNGDARVYFAGILEQSTNLVDWAEVPGPPSSPYLLTPATSPFPLFLRTRR